MLKYLHWRRWDLLVLVLICLLKATQVEAQMTITLGWDPNSEPDIAGYVIGYGTKPGVDDDMVYVGLATQWTLTGLTPATAYYFRVYAYNLAGMRSGPSAQVSNALLGGTVTSSGCLTPDPFASLGGGTCHNGGWLPSGMAPATAAPAPTTVASAPTSICTSPDPFVALGGGTCYDGGWLPPGMAVPEGAVTSSAPTTAASTTVTGITGCVTPDPFVGLPELIGLCRDGGWVPVPGVSTTGTMFYSHLDGFWGIDGDDGRMYRPLAVVPFEQQQTELRVMFEGTFEGELSEPVPIQLISLRVLITQ